VGDIERAVGSKAAVGRVLKDLRVSASMTQQQLAAILGTPQSFVSKYEIGERRLDVLEVRSVCVALGATLHGFVDLLERELSHEG
jgi:transcriptional regulator with XRE-family HTH domain